VGLVAAGHAVSVREPAATSAGWAGQAGRAGWRERPQRWATQRGARAGGPREAGSCQARRGAGPGDAAARAGLGACWGKAARGSRAPGCVGAPPRWLATALAGRRAGAVGDFGSGDLAGSAGEGE
jgi:hypothetical protein